MYRAFQICFFNLSVLQATNKRGHFQSALHQYSPLFKEIEEH